MLKRGVYSAGFFILTFLFLVGCGEYEKILKSRDYEQKYKVAMQYYEDEEYVRAATLLDQVVNIFRGTSRVDTVKYYQAMSYYGQRDYMLAQHYFDELASTYSNSVYVQEAEFMSAYCYYKLAPRADLDQQATKNAITAFRIYLSKYPTSERAAECQEIITTLSDRLVEKSYNSAKLYYELGYYKSAIIALRNSILEHPDTQYREDIMFLILRSSFLLADNSIPSKRKERLQAAMDEYLSFSSEFPESEYIKDAERIFKNTQRELDLYTSNDL